MLQNQWRGLWWVLTPGGCRHDEAGYHVVGDDWRVAGRRRAYERIDYVVRGRAHHARQLRRLRARRPGYKSLLKTLSKYNLHPTNKTEYLIYRNNTWCVYSRLYESLATRRKGYNADAKDNITVRISRFSHRDNQNETKWIYYFRREMKNINWEGNATIKMLLYLISIYREISFIVIMLKVTFCFLSSLWSLYSYYPLLCRYSQVVYSYKRWRCFAKR